MSWQMTGNIVGSCSCKMNCRCILGPAEPDQGWCSAALGMHIQSGNSEGVDLSGSKVVIALDLPGDFVSGIDSARLYFDESASEEQRAQLEAIFMGQKGGVWENLNAAVAKWLPAKVTGVSVADGENPSFEVAGIGSATLQRLKSPDGKQTTIHNAPVTAGAFGVERGELSMAENTSWNDPDMRSWQSLGYGTVEPFNWSG